MTDHTDLRHLLKFSQEILETVLFKNNINEGKGSGTERDDTRCIHCCLIGK